MGLILAILRRLGRAAQRGAQTPAYPSFVAAIAFLLTATMTVPFGSILAVAVLLAPQRWRIIAVLSSLGSSLGAVAVYLAFHHLGWEQFVEAYPDLSQSRGWLAATRWVSAYGVYALFVIAALPMPQSPALIFAGITQLPIAAVWAAIFLGKLLKYGLYSGVVAMFPARFARQYAALLAYARQGRV